MRGFFIGESPVDGGVAPPDTADEAATGESGDEAVEEVPVVGGEDAQGEYAGEVEEEAEGDGKRPQGSAQEQHDEGGGQPDQQQT